MIPMIKPTLMIWMMGYWQGSGWRSMGEYEGVCLNPKDIPPDDLDDEVLGRMVQEAGMLSSKVKFDTLRKKPTLCLTRQYGG